MHIHTCMWSQTQAPKHNNVHTHAFLDVHKNMCTPSPTRTHVQARPCAYQRLRRVSCARLYKHTHTRTDHHIPCSLLAGLLFPPRSLALSLSLYPFIPPTAPPAAPRRGLKPMHTQQHATNNQQATTDRSRQTADRLQTKTSNGRQTADTDELHTRQ